MSIIKRNHFGGWLQYLIYLVLLKIDWWTFSSAHSIAINVTRNNKIFREPTYASENLNFEEPFNFDEISNNNDISANFLKTNLEISNKSQVFDLGTGSGSSSGYVSDSDSGSRWKEEKRKDNKKSDLSKVYVKIAHYIEADFTDDKQYEIYRLIAVGDTGGMSSYPYVSSRQIRVANTMEKFVKIDKTSILMLGDNFYYSGVKNMNDMRFNETFEKVYIGPLKKTDWYVIAGNHDYIGNVTAQMEYRKISKRWKYPYLYYEIVFEIDIKYRHNGSLKETITIVVLMLDTIILDLHKYYATGLEADKYMNNASRQSQKKWLRNISTRFKIKWLIELF
ncbi:unnamed protein product [Gordionus sp. m RMFG-2023]